MTPALALAPKKSNQKITQLVNGRPFTPLGWSARRASRCGKDEQ